MLHINHRSQSCKWTNNNLNIACSARPLYAVTSDCRTVKTPDHTAPRSYPTLVELIHKRKAKTPEARNKSAQATCRLHQHDSSRSRSFNFRGRSHRCGLAVTLLLAVLLSALGKQRGIITDSLDDAETLGASLAEQKPIARSEILRPLDEAERHGGAIAGADEWTIDIDDAARLRDGAYVQHGLVFLLDGGDVIEDEDVGDELAVDARSRGAIGWPWEDDHALAHFLAPNFLECEGG